MSEQENEEVWLVEMVVGGVQAKLYSRWEPAAYVRSQGITEPRGAPPQFMNGDTLVELTAEPFEGAPTIAHIDLSAVQWLSWRRLPLQEARALLERWGTP